MLSVVSLFMMLVGAAILFIATKQLYPACKKAESEREKFNLKCTLIVNIAIGVLLILNGIFILAH